jgi:hypothetical protein
MRNIYKFMEASRGDHLRKLLREAQGVVDGVLKR